MCYISAVVNMESGEFNSYVEIVDNITHQGQSGRRHLLPHLRLRGCAAFFVTTRPMTGERRQNQQILIGLVPSPTLRRGTYQLSV